MPNSDFYPFSPSSHSDWLDQIRKDLKGKIESSSLNSTLWEEIQIEPTYSFEEKLSHPEPIQFNPKSKLPGLSPRIWNNLVSPKGGNEQSTNQEILEVLQLGAEGLVLRLDGTEDLNLILKGVLTTYIQVYFLPTGPAKPVFELVKNWVETNQLSSEMLKGGILWSPTGELFKGKKNLEIEVSLALHYLPTFHSFPDFYPIIVDFARYANAGGTGIQELSYGFGELIEILDHFGKNGILPEKAISQIAFHSAVGENHFPEIAKLKAIRLFAADLISNLGGNTSPESIHLLASTSRWTKPLLDPNSSLIRQTYEAMAAVLGGCNSLWVRPQNELDADPLFSRIARNVGTILREESFLDKVMDPAAGAYFIDHIQNELEEKVIDHLKTMEESGGWLGNFLNQTIHTNVENSAKSIQEAVLYKQKISVGVNSFELKNGQLVAGAEQELEEFDLPETRLSKLIELDKLKNA